MRHHVHAKRRFGDKDNVVLLCFRCHSTMLHQHGYGWFEEQTGVSLDDFEAEAQRIYAAFTEILQDNGGMPF